MSQRSGNGSEEMSDHASEGSQREVEANSSVEVQAPEETAVETDPNPAEGRKQLRQILDRKLGRGSDPADPRNADTLELQLDASEAEKSKDLSWSALLNPGLNQSLRDEVVVPQIKEPVRQPTPKPEAAAKPASKSASVKSETPKRKEAPRKQSSASARDTREEAKGGFSARASRRESDSRRAEELGSASERGGRSSLILQLAKKDLERRSGRTPDSSKAGKVTYTDTSEDSALGEIVPTANLRLPEVPRLPLGSISPQEPARRTSPSPNVSPDSRVQEAKENEQSPPAVKKPPSKPPLSPKLQFDTEERLDTAVKVEEPPTEREMREVAIQTDERFNPRLRKVLDVLCDQKVLKGLKFVGGFARYLHTVGFQA